ncbi:EthD family reductase [Dyadobacter arcticus]|uniref:Uncharacterized protein (TIGR02118 family) n=1 Tax=Dyadobacter arcticus TaxID=1078754 RepID=A0ABX0UIS5_9BACT|nr:EthD family reductase [Dyadobacter arcticus]NIJ52908.1 uncharacterized protein (TIGR02118 family) [Dyadobacter arcticus]
MNLTCLYPKTETMWFDRDYYLNEHIPLVRKRLTPLGLNKIDIEEGLAGGVPGTPPAYIIVAKLSFDSLEILQNALGTHGPELISDIANFTDVQPVMQLGISI